MTAGAAARPWKGSHTAIRGTGVDSAWPLLKFLAVGAVMPVVVEILFLVSTAFLMSVMGVHGAKVMYTMDPAVASSHQLATAVSAQEAGVLGFAATGDPAFRARFAGGAGGQEAALVGLDAAVDRGVPIGRQLGALRQAHQRWLTGYAQPVLAGAPDAPAQQAGRALFADVRTAAEALTAEVERQRGDLHDSWSLAFWVVTGVSVATIAIVPVWLVFIGFWLRRRVVRPIHRLGGRVREVASGDFHRALRGSGPREFRELGADVEEMRRHIVRDLDEAEDLNRRLDEQARDLSRSNRDLEQFAYVASHDLQEPLRKVASFCQVLQRRYAGKLDARADQYIEFAVDGARRMQSLINDLLAFSRVGRNTSAFEIVDLTEVAAAAAAELDAARREADGEVVIGELPTVKGDPSLLQALLVNLIGNGIKFRREGEPPVVRLSARRADGVWEVSVSDNGIGISPEYAEKIFVIFQRLHAREKYAGTGIGLALSKKIVEFHGGAIGLADSPGPGTTIRFTLPATEGGAT